MTLPAQDHAALAFVLTHGSPLERWRAARLAGCTEPLPPDWAVRQNPDGGWRSREHSSPLSNMGTTSIMLMRMAHAGLLHTPEGGSTIGYLRRTQQSDGRWTENPAQWETADLPEWNQPGELTNDLWETANCAAVLAGAGHAGDPRVRQAVDWVGAHARPDGTFPGYIHTTFAMAAARQALGDYAARDRFLQASEALLAKHGTKDWWDVMDLTWPLVLWHIAAIPRDLPAVQRYRKALLARRGAGGIWTSIYPNCDTTYTMEALELLHAS